MRRKRRQLTDLRKGVQSSGDGDSNLLPIMSLMLILIPFLVGQVAFMHLKSISINTPGASSSEELEEDPKEKSVVIQLDVYHQKYQVQLLEESSGNPIAVTDLVAGSQAQQRLFALLQQWRRYYPKLKILLVNIDSSILYQDMVRVLDTCRKPIELAGQSTPFKFKVIVVPKEST